MKNVRWIYVLLALAVVGCQRDENNALDTAPQKTGVVVVKLGDGALVTADCVREAYQAQVMPTEYCQHLTPNSSTEGTRSLNSSRGFYSTSTYDFTYYYNNPAYTTYYAVYNPVYFQNALYQLGIPGASWGFLGYPNYNYYNYYSQTPYGCNTANWYGYYYQTYGSCWDSYWWR